MKNNRFSLKKKNKKSSLKQGSNKRGSNKRGSNKRGSNKRGSKNKRNLKGGERNNTSFKRYHIHDNGGKPFQVDVKQSEILVYAHDPIEEIQKRNSPKLVTIKEFVFNTLTKTDYNTLLFTIKWFEKYWDQGFYSYEKTIANGNSLLILLNSKKNEYIFIGSSIYQFETLEEIKDFISPIGNNDVPYPVAYSENFFYFFIEEGDGKGGYYVDKKLFPPIVEPMVEPMVESLDLLSKSLDTLIDVYFDNKAIQKNRKHFKNFKMIVERDYKFFSIQYKLKS